MAKTASVAVVAFRASSDDLQRLQSLSHRLGGASVSDVLRTLVRSATDARAATVTFESSNGAGVRQDIPRAVVG